MLNEENASKPIKLIERVEKYKGHVITVYEDHLDIGGQDAYWDFIHHNGAAAVLPVTDDGELLLVRQFRHALGRYTLELPAGKRDGDEDYLVCATRELKEETGFTADHMDYLLTVNTTVAYLDEIIYIYLARGLHAGQTDWDAEEELGLEKWKLPDLIDMIRAGKMTDAKTIAAIMTYAQMINAQKKD